MAARRTSEEARVERPDLEVPIPYSGLCPTPQEPDNFLLDVRARRRLDEQIGERPVAGREQCRTVQAVVVEDPPSKEKGGSLVALAERLRTRDTKGEHGRGHDRIIDFVD